MHHGTYSLHPKVVTSSDLGIDRRYGGKECWYGRG